MRTRKKRTITSWEQSTEKLTQKVESFRKRQWLEQRSWGRTVRRQNSKKLLKRPKQGWELTKVLDLRFQKTTLAMARMMVMIR